MYGCVLLVLFVDPFLLGTHYALRYQRTLFSRTINDSLYIYQIDDNCSSSQNVVFQRREPLYFNRFQGGRFSERHFVSRIVMTKSLHAYVGGHVLELGSLMSISRVAFPGLLTHCAAVATVKKRRHNSFFYPSYSLPNVRILVPAFSMTIYPVLI